MSRSVIISTRLASFTIPKIQRRYISYVQGQEPEPRVREYFYFIDHQGMLFLDDTKIKNFTSCFKEKKFLAFFFKRVRINDTGRFEKDFPYWSPCGRERNFIRCDDRPIVYTHVINVDDQQYLTYGYAGDVLKVPFQPEELCMYPASGRVYHTAADAVGGVGLIRSALAIELSNHFTWGQGSQPDIDHPTGFSWQGRNYHLHNRLVDVLNAEEERFRMKSDDG